MENEARLNLSLPRELKRLLLEAGVERGESLRAVCRRLLWDGVHKNGTEKVQEAHRKSAERVQRETDPRHGPVKALIDTTYKRQFGLDCPWGPEEAGQLGQLLRQNPNWTLPQLKTMVENRFLSEGVTGDRPMQWLKDLSRYAAGPLNKFGRVDVPGPKKPEVKFVRADGGARDISAVAGAASADADAKVEAGAGGDRGR